MVFYNQIIKLKSRLKILLCLFIFSGLSIVGCKNSIDLGEMDFLDLEDDSILKKVFSDPEKYELQIQYVQINRDGEGKAILKPFNYRVDSTMYFYPASTVKMPVAILALEKLNKLYKQNIDIDYNTALKILAPRNPPQTLVLKDSTSEDHLPSIGHYVEKALVISDNDAYNRLYEFLGPEAINEELRKKGIFTNSRIIHRLSAPEFNTTENRYTNPFVFYNGSDTVYRQAEQYMEARVFDSLINTQKGKGFINKDGELVNEPFNFNEKNFVSIQDLQRTLIALIMQDGTFDLRKEDYELLYKNMSSFQKESTPDHIRIFHKEGNAYGYLTDCAYFVDFKNKIDFFLTATIHVNSNGIYNDGIYEYEDVGLPFLSALLSQIHEYELKRNRTYIGDFSRFKLNYK